MCGIGGYVDLSGGPPEETVVAEMMDRLRHRGPESAAVDVLAAGPPGPTVVLGHRRLAIIDLSDEAGQPMANEDGSILVSFNGEIYNFGVLRRDLETRGHHFRSRSDTEVIVHAYETFGDSFVEHLDGMFAFALWDGGRRRLVLARDRAGKKPLYYSWDGRRLTFASEIKAIRCCPWVDDGVDWDRVPEFLAFGYVPWPHTFHRAIRQVPPASSVVLGQEGLSEPRPYWALKFAGADGVSREGWPEATRRVRELLRTAVERRLVADVPLGVLLSGGIDSSAIVGMMSSLVAPIRTFTVGIGGDPSYDERTFGRLVARRFGTEHTEVMVNVDAADLLERLLWFLDQPFGDSSALPTYLIARAAREHVTVALTGDGGDETFGGYERFGAALLADRLPVAFQRPLGRLAPRLPRTGGYHELRRSVERFARNPGWPPEQRYRDWVALFDGGWIRRILSQEAPAADETDPHVSFNKACMEAGEVPLLHRLLFANFRTYLHDDLLVKTDRMSMASSLEARSPFLDTALVEYVASLPPNMKATPFGLKRLLRRSLKGLVPEEILRRRKHGFGVPVGRWFRGQLRDPFFDLVLDPRARSAVALDGAGIRSLFQEHQEGRADHGQRLWALFSLEVWLRMLERPDRQAPPAEPEIVTSPVRDR